MTDPEYENELCEAFLDNPNVNPIDGKRLIYGKGPYIGFVALCRTYGYDTTGLLSEELNNRYYGSRSPSRSRSPQRSRSPVRSLPLRDTSVRSPVRSIPLRPTESGSVEIAPLSKSVSFEVNPAPPLNVQRSVATRSSPPLSVPIVRGPSIQAQYSETRETIGEETFDPDPVTTVTRTSQPPVRTTVRGPYGVNGEYANTTGVYKAPDQLRYTTYDYPEHRVGTRVSPTYNSQTITTGREEFDPDPITRVIEESSRSVREDVIGPYGPNGENVRVSGVHTLPGQRRYVTIDYPNHSVVTNTNSLY